MPIDKYGGVFERDFRLGDREPLEDVPHALPHALLDIQLHRLTHRLKRLVKSDTGAQEDDGAISL